MSDTRSAAASPHVRISPGSIVGAGGVVYARSFLRNCNWFVIVTRSNHQGLASMLACNSKHRDISWALGDIQHISEWHSSILLPG
jgi:hypothetical protein